MSIKNVLMGLYAQASDNPDIDLSDANATGNDVLVGKTFFAGNTQLKSGTMPVLEETIYTPTEQQQIISAGRYLQGNQIINAVNLGEKTITANGTYLASNDGVLGYKNVNINVPTPTEPYIEETYNASGNLTNAVLHGYVRIRKYAFYNCIELTSILLPDELISIEQGAFSQCTNLALTSLPVNLKTISLEVFYRCTNLTLTSLPSGITSIGNTAFSQCTNLALTSLPSGIISIGNNVFSSCSKLALTSLPSEVTIIGSYAFSSCTGLISITFQGTPTTIANNAFQGCTNLTTINVPWLEGAVANAPWGATAATINYNYVGA